jgi:high-affinity iron transporter
VHQQPDQFGREQPGPAIVRAPAQRSPRPPRASLAGRLRAGRRLAALLLAGCIAAASAAGATPTQAATAQTTTAPAKPVGERASSVQAAPTSAAIAASDAAGLHAVLAALPDEYASAVPTHDATIAAVSRALAGGARTRVLALRAPLDARDAAASASVVRTLDRLVALLAPTRVRLQPWPLTLEVSALSERAQRTLAGLAPPPPRRSRSYAAIEAALERAERDALGGHPQRASFALLHGYALYAAGPGPRLRSSDPSLEQQITGEALLGGARAPSLAYLLAHGASRSELRAASRRIRAAMSLVAQTLGEVQVAHATIVANAAIIVFREGLEAVLILAAITASFVGARSRLRKPVLLGGLAGLLATALTWVIAQLLLHLLGDGGLRLQAITGLLAIVVLLLVTNWFFHRVYWSQWISRFNRRRRTIERWDRLGFVSGQVLGFVLLGLSSVYREGLETVLFLQALQSSAGTATTALGAGIGLAGTLVVGAITFKMQRKLPFKRMLIVTGVLIALVLAVMTGTTVHTMQGIGWLPTTPTSFAVSVTWSQWLGLYPTWEGIGAQLLALAFVFGSYLAAREVQVKRPQRRSKRADQAIAGAPISGTSA